MSVTRWLIEFLRTIIKAFQSHLPCRFSLLHLHMRIVAQANLTRIRLALFAELIGQMLTRGLGENATGRQSFTRLTSII